MHETNNSLMPKTSMIDFAEGNNVSNHVITSNILVFAQRRLEGLEQDKSKAQM